MNASPNIERRARFDNSPRVTYAPNSVTGNCQLVRVDSLAHAYMVWMGFAELDRDGDSVLMRCPENWTP